MKELSVLIIGIAAYYRIKLDDLTVRMYASDLADLPIEQVIAAYEECRRDPKIKTMPLPAEIRSRIKPELTDEEQARMIAASVIGAVSRLGPYCSSENLKREIGEIGVDIVRRLGGWFNLCSMMDSGNQGVYSAQIRDLAIPYLKIESGATHWLSDSSPTALPETKKLLDAHDKLIAGLLEQKTIKN